MRILLFNPWIIDFAAFDLWTRPLNLLRLASVLRGMGVTVDFFDCLDRHSILLEGCKTHTHRLNPYGCGHYVQEEIPVPEILSSIPRKFRRFGIPQEQVKQHLSSFQSPDAVVIPCMMTYWYLGAFEAIQLIRKLFPGVPVFLGGIYPILCYEHAKMYSGADHILIGKNWHDIAYNIINKIANKPVLLEGNYSTWIPPAYDLLAYETSFPLLTSAGCPFHCTYCATHSIWPKFAQYNPEDVVESIGELVNKYHASDIAFFDDALLIHKEKHFLVIMEEILRRGWKLRFHTPNALHVREIDTETALLMKKVGFKTLRLALEIVNPDWQKQSGAKVFTDEYLLAAESLKNAGFTANEVGTYIMYGLPGQTMALFWESCQVVFKAGNEVKIALYSPVPGTGLFTEGREEFIFDHNTDPLLQNNTLAPWRSRKIPASEYRRITNQVAQINRNLRENKDFTL